MQGQTSTTRHGAQDAQPADIHLVTGETITAPDIDRREHWVIVYYAEKTGIDQLVPRDAIIRINRLNDDENSGELIADGGRDIPPCANCGADLIENTALTTGEVAGRTQPPVGTRTVPVAECQCRKSVAAMFGRETVKAVWEARGETMPGHDGEDDAQLVTDGSQSIESGDYVNYDGEEMRVGRVTGQYAEVYADGVAPHPVPINDVEPVQNGGESSW